MFGEGLMRPIRRGGELDAVHAHQLVELVAQQLGQRAVAAALDDPVMEVEVAFLLVVTDASLKRLIAFVSAEHPTQLIDLRLAHAFGGKATGHAFQGLTDFVEFDQLGMAQRNHARAHMGNADKQFLALQPVDSLAQRPAADAVGTRQFGLGNLAARRNLTLDDRSLDQAEHVLGKCAAIKLLH